MCVWGVYPLVYPNECEFQYSVHGLPLCGRLMSKPQPHVTSLTLCLVASRDGRCPGNDGHLKRLGIRWLMGGDKRQRCVMGYFAEPYTMAHAREGCGPERGGRFVLGVRAVTRDGKNARPGCAASH